MKHKKAIKEKKLLYHLRFHKRRGKLVLRGFKISFYIQQILLFEC